MSVPIHPLVSPWGRFGLHSFLLDTPEPAIVDTGIASSPAEGMAPALATLGRRIEDVRWILLTHGHIDHIGGAHALWELTGRRAEVVIHESDAHLLRSRRAHVDEYLAGRGRYVRDPGAEARQTAAAEAVISGEMDPTVPVTGGETLSLGGVEVRVHHLPGHTAGSVAYEVDGAVLVGDAVQSCGAANGFPGYADPAAYRASLRYLRDVVRPQRLFPGHPFHGPNGAYRPEQAHDALTDSLAREAEIARVAHPPHETDSLHSPYAKAAAELGYDRDPRLEPSPFFTTMHGYARSST